jgi:hypothetical protein
MRIKVGSIVRCRFFNSVNKKFYDDSWDTEVLEIKEPENRNSKPTFLVERKRMSHHEGMPRQTIWIKRKEILRVVK